MSGEFNWSQLIIAQDMIHLCTLQLPSNLHHPVSINSFAGNPGHLLRWYIYTTTSYTQDSVTLVLIPNLQYFFRMALSFAWLGDFLNEQVEWIGIPLLTKLRRRAQIGPHVFWMQVVIEPNTFRGIQYAYLYIYLASICNAMPIRHQGTAFLNSPI